MTRLFSNRRTAALAGITICLLAGTTIGVATWALRRVYAAYERARTEERRENEATQRDLTTEFNAIRAPQNDLKVHDGTMTNLIQATYKSTLAFERIKSHYDEQLRRRGWTLLREDPVIYDGHDYGGKEVIYCKGGYAASLQYAGRQEMQFGWTYAIALSSGLHCK